MYIRSLKLHNFRNYTIEEFDFHPGTNILYGDNAQGKTNVLEAIFVGGTTKSHKKSKDSDMIKRGEINSHIRYDIDRSGKEIRVELHLKKNGKKGIAIDGIPIKKSNELLGISNIVFFSPEDLGIIKEGPDARRRFIDLELCQLNKAYLYYLTRYKQILRQRNALLKKIKETNNDPQLKNSLDIWDDQLIEAGSQVITHRMGFIDELDEIMKKKHESLTGGKEDIHISYKPNVTNKNFEEKIFIERDRDIYTGTTTVGPHRDDIVFLNGNEDIRKYGSQGQIRTAALSLKMSEIDIVKKITSEKPVLLLDDVLSELDRHRQSFLLENIHGIQTIITCTGLEEFVESGINIDKTFHINKGHIDKVNVKDTMNKIYKDDNQKNGG